MALSLDDKLLGEKTDYYCSSSDEEAEDNTQAAADTAPGVNQYSGHCVNTGPKGVVEDWRRFKQLEIEKREEQANETQLLAKRLAFTCRSELDDRNEAAKDAEFVQQLEEEFDNLDEQFLREYRFKRLEELRNTYQAVSQFGNVFDLSTSEFIDSIDKAHSTVFVIIHIYEKGMAACDAINRCFDSLAADYPSVKFCRIRASEARLSINFAVSGLPAILVYKEGELIGNFVRLTDEFGDDAYPADIECFLIEHGMLPSQSLLPTSIRSTASASRPNHSDTDSDLD